MCLNCSQRFPHDRAFARIVLVKFAAPWRSSGSCSAAVPWPSNPPRQPQIFAANRSRSITPGSRPRHARGPHRPTKPARHASRANRAPQLGSDASHSVQAAALAVGRRPITIPAALLPLGFVQQSARRDVRSCRRPGTADRLRPDHVRLRQQRSRRPAAPQGSGLCRFSVPGRSRLDT